MIDRITNAELSTEALPFARPLLCDVALDEAVKDEKYYQEQRRNQISNLAKRGAQIKNIGKMCNTCAFKLNSDANLEPHNVESAWDCLAYDGKFNCHIQIGVDKGCECIGFKYAKQFFDSLD